MKTMKDFKGSQGTFTPIHSDDEDGTRIITNDYQRVAILIGPVAHREANAKLFAASKKLLEGVLKFQTFLKQMNVDGMETQEIALLVAMELKFEDFTEQAINEAL